MKPVRFKGANSQFTDQENTDIPAYKSNDRNGVVVCRFKLSFKERIYILLFGNIWFSQATYNASLKPFKISIFKNAVLHRVKDKK